VKPTILQSLKDNFKVNYENEIVGIGNSFENSFKKSVEDIKLEMQGQHFNLDNSFNDSMNIAGNRLSMNFMANSHDLYYLAVSKLNGKSSAGPDGIRPQDVKNNVFRLKMVIMH
jgi:hypothetical protein